MSLKFSDLSERARERVNAGGDELRASVLDRLAAPAESHLSLPRLLVIFAHPDDEVLAAGGRLERFRESRLLCVTDGAPENGADSRAHGFATLQAYRDARRAELAAALRLGGLPEGCAEPLRLDRSGGTPAGVADQRAVFHLRALTTAVAREIELYRPEAVLTHPCEGGHPDHDSCAFAVHIAVRLVRGTPPPTILEAPFYHAGANGMETGSFLGDGEASSVDLTLRRVCELSPVERARKRERLDCFVTQRETLAQFGIEREQFRVAPLYDFCRPPHPGRLLYENFAWGATGEQFRALAASALGEVGLGKTSLGSIRE